MTVSVIIVTYNSADCIESCLRSVMRQRDIDVQTVVIDNASSDQTRERVRETTPAVQLIANRDNVGFGRANNQGADASQGRLLYLLNPDAELTGEDGLSRLVSEMDSHPHWGLAGTRVCPADGAEESLPGLTYPDQYLAENSFDRLPGAIAWVLGASMIVRREAFNAVEGFDPSFFLHSEETDLCLRVRQAGFEIGYIPEVEVRHVGGASDALSDCYAAWIRRMTGLHRFWTKHYSHADVIRLARRDLRRSWLRSTIYGAILRFCPQSVRVYEKQRRNDAIRDASRHLLARCRAGDS